MQYFAGTIKSYNSNQEFSLATIVKYLALLFPISPVRIFVDLGVRSKNINRFGCHLMHINM